jgi:hypothetical protein
VAQPALTLQSQIPDTFRNKLAVEDAVRRALADLPGEWVVTIQATRTATLLFKIEGPDGFYRAMFLDGPGNQNAQLIHDRVKAALQDRRSRTRAAPAIPAWRPAGGTRIEDIASRSNNDELTREVADFLGLTREDRS